MYIHSENLGVNPMLSYELQMISNNIPNGAIKNQISVIKGTKKTES